MIATASKGGTLTIYSSRFSMPDNTGTFSPVVTTALSKISGTDGPKNEDRIADAPDAAPGNEFEAPYTMQTGPTRYAPMQPVPPTKITKKDHKPLHPTSAFTIATTFLPNPKVQTTVTQKQTFSVKSRENTVSGVFYFLAGRWENSNLGGFGGVVMDKCFCKPVFEWAMRLTESEQVAAAPHPTDADDDMAKFLKRWKD